MVSWPSIKQIHVFEFEGYLSVPNSIFSELLHLYDGQQCIGTLGCSV